MAELIESSGRKCRCDVTWSNICRKLQKIMRSNKWTQPRSIAIYRQITFFSRFGFLFLFRVCLRCAVRILSHSASVCGRKKDREKKLWFHSFWHAFAHTIHLWPGIESKDDDDEEEEDMEERTQIDADVTTASAGVRGRAQNTCTRNLFSFLCQLN